MSSHRRNQTHRQIPREIEAGVPENRSQKKQSAPQKPTDPWVFGYGKSPWETAAETLWETDVWYLLCPRMVEWPDLAADLSSSFESIWERFAPRPSTGDKRRRAAVNRAVSAVRGEVPGPLPRNGPPRKRARARAFTAR